MTCAHVLAADLEVLEPLKVGQQTPRHSLVADDEDVLLRALHLEDARFQPLDQVIVRLAAWIARRVLVELALRKELRERNLGA